jgi:cholesterol transport system auxiliary component
MTSSSKPSLLALVAVVLAAGGCALFSKSDIVQVRYFSPEPTTTGQARSPRAKAATHCGRIALRLGRISAPEHLEERFVYRSSPHEFGYYDERRWTEEPEEYLRRALARELFEVRGIERVVSGAAPTLEVELTAFEEVRGPTPKARVGLTFVLHDEKSVQVERSLIVDRSVAARDARGFVLALSSALAAAIDAVSDEVSLELERQGNEPSAEPCITPDREHDTEPVLDAD